MTAGKPTIRPSLKILLSGLFFSKNFKEAPMPRRTVEILCVAVLILDWEFTVLELTASSQKKYFVGINIFL